MADGDLYLSDSPNVDKGFVEQDGQLRGVKLQAVPDGTLELSNSANVSSGYVTDTDGKKHKVNLVATVEGTLELPDAPNADTGYVVDGDGKKHKVQLTATLYGGGSAPVIDELNVTPSTSAQTITASGGTDGYSPVNVAAVTSSIDANIVAGNIKKDVSILGVTGSYEGVPPSGTKSITTNGIHDVAGYASADVQVPTTAPAYYIEFTKNANNVLNTPTTFMDLTGVTDLAKEVLRHRYSRITSISGVIDMSPLLKNSGQDSCANTFDGCTNITGINLSNLRLVSGQTCFSSFCNGCSNLANLNLNKLESVSGNQAFVAAFRLTKLVSVALPSLTRLIGGRGIQTAFGQISTLTSASLPSLSIVTGSQECLGSFNQTHITTLSLPALRVLGANTNQFTNMLQGVSGCTVHFPANLQSTMGSWSDVTAGFGGTSTTVLWDLPSTFILTGANTTQYERNPRDDTATALAWRVLDGGTDADPVIDWTSFYTSGTTDPSVGDTIYSDAACTTPVTTISSIA